MRRPSVIGRVRPLRATLIAMSVSVTAAACSRHHPTEFPSPIPRVEGVERTAFALREIDLAAGSGAPVEPKKCLYAHYTGWLTNGKQFDSSRDTMPNGKPREPISFAQGFRRVIAGWDAGFEGMRVGGRRRLIIPYQLAYGEAGRPPVIPPKAELVFDVELMAVADTLAHETVAVPRGTPTPAPRCPEWAAVAAQR